MPQLMQTICVVLLTLLGCYLLFVFWSLEPNPLEWSQDGRVLGSILAIFCAAFAAVMLRIK